MSWLGGDCVKYRTKSHLHGERRFVGLGSLAGNDEMKHICHRSVISLAQLLGRSEREAGCAASVQ